MRPDAHKQKASAKYKKKRGLGETSKSGPPETTQKKGAKHVVSGAQGTGVAKEGTSASNTSTVTGVGNTDSANISKQAETTQLNLKLKEASEAGSSPGYEQEQQNFRRRKIISNWDRYAGLEPISTDDNIETQRGADFAALLKVASTAQSQFRFADEREWDLADTDTLSDCSSSLHIDSVELAAALECVPLHKRLNLDPQIFTSDQLARFKSVAELQHRSCKSRSKTTSTDAIDGTQARLTVDADFDDEFLKPYLVTPTDDLPPSAVDSKPDSIIERVPVPDKTSLVPNIPDKTHDEVVASVGALSLENVKSPPNPETCESDQINAKEPDSTLIGESEGSQKELPKNTKDSGVQGPQQEDLNKEDELDFLLSLDAPIKTDAEDGRRQEPASVLPLHTDKEKAIPSADSNSSSQSAAKECIPQSSTTNLEDWLDTMLDD